MGFWSRSPTREDRKRLVNRRIRNKASTTVQQTSDGYTGTPQRELDRTRIAVAGEQALVPTMQSNREQLNGFIGPDYDRRTNTDGQSSADSRFVLAEGDNRARNMAGISERYLHDKQASANDLTTLPAQLHSIKSSPTSQGLWSWIPHVAQSADDATVKDRVKDVFSFAEQFVNNFYEDLPYEDEASVEVIEPINCSHLLSTSELRKLLIEADYQTSLIKHTLISLLIELISFDSPSSQKSLLPKELQNYSLLAIAKTNSTTAGEEIPHLQPALSAYRVLSTYIRPHAQRDENYLKERRLIIVEITQAFEHAFQHWIRIDRRHDDRSTSFHELLEKTAELGVFLFSQPSVFVFDWKIEPENQVHASIPVHPRLLRAYDDNAQFKTWADHMIPMKLCMVSRPVGQKVKSRLIARDDSSEALDLGPTLSQPIGDDLEPLTTDNKHDMSETSDTLEQTMKDRPDNDKLPSRSAQYGLPEYRPQHRGRFPFYVQASTGEYHSPDRYDESFSRAEEQSKHPFNLSDWKNYLSEYTAKRQQLPNASRSLPPPPYMVGPETKEQALSAAQITPSQIQTEGQVRGFFTSSRYPRKPLPNPYQSGNLLARHRFNPDFNNSTRNAYQPWQSFPRSYSFDDEHGRFNSNFDHQTTLQSLRAPTQGTSYRKQEYSSSPSPPKRMSDRRRDHEYDMPPNSWLTNKNTNGVNRHGRIPIDSPESSPQVERERSGRRRSYSDSSVPDQSRSSSLSSLRRKMVQAARYLDGKE